MGTQSQIWTAVAAIGTFLAGMAAVVGITWRPHPAETSVAVFDSLSAPATELFLIFPDGERVETSRDGLIVIPDSRAGTEASLRDAKTRRELCRFVVPRGGGEFVRVNLDSCRSER